MKRNETMTKENETLTKQSEKMIKQNELKTAEMEQRTLGENGFSTDGMNANTIEQNEIVELSNEITYRSYLMNKNKIRELFRKVSISEYIALYKIVFLGESESLYSGKTYLKNLAEKMELTIQQASKMVEGLQDRGLVLWSHDGDGSEGTYVKITENGEKLFKEQENVLRDYYGKVIVKFGKEKLMQLLQLMRELDQVMSYELEESSVL